MLEARPGHRLTRETPRVGWGTRQTATTKTLMVETVGPGSLLTVEQTARWIGERRSFLMQSHVSYVCQPRPTRLALSPSPLMIESTSRCLDQRYWKAEAGNSLCGSTELACSGRDKEGARQVTRRAVAREVGRGDSRKERW